MRNIVDEWSPLKEVMVGNCLNWKAYNDLSFRLMHHENLSAYGGKLTSGVIEHEMDRVRDRIADLDSLANILRHYGVKVYRPRPLDKLTTVKSPTWETVLTAPDQPRDMFFCLNDTIIETPSPVRSRIYENRHYRDLFNTLFEDGHKWICAPTPILEQQTLDAYHMQNWRNYTRSYETRDYDIAFEAANLVKMGEDKSGRPQLLMNVANLNAQRGAKWLGSVMPECDIYTTTVCDDHIDGVLMPLDEGVFLLNNQVDVSWIKDRLPSRYAKWKFIQTEHEELDDSYTADEVKIASEQCMALNVLSLDPTTVIIPDDAKRTMDKLDKHGFSCVPVTFRHTRLFAGGIHCATVDISRRG